MKTVLVVAPRNHPNIEHIVLSLNQVGAEVILLVDYVTGDGPSNRVGLRVVTTDSIKSSMRIWLESIDPDLIIQRSFPKSITKQIRHFAGQFQTPWIQYDQRILRFGIIGTLVEFSHYLYRRIVGRPRTRITPVSENIGSVGQFAHSFNYPFLAVENLVLPSSSDPERPLRVLTIGKLWQKRKRQILLIRALAKLNFHGELVIIGATHGAKGSMNPKGVESAIYRLQEERRMSGGKYELKVLTDLSHNATMVHLSSSDIFCLPSVREPFAISPMEAMSLGLPVIISGSNGATSYLNNYADGIIFEPDSEKSLRLALAQLIESKPLRISLGTSARQRLIEQHGPESFINLLSNLGFRPDSDAE